MRQADRIRKYVLDNYIEPARRRGERFITVRAGDVGKAMALKNRMPAIASAFKGREFESYYNWWVGSLGSGTGRTISTSFA